MDAGVGSQDFAAAFGPLYPQARSVALRILGSMPAAEDAAAEALTRALVDWDRVGTLPYCDAWVLRVTANVAIDVARRPTPAYGASPPSGDDGDLIVLRMALVDALASLPRRQREAVVLRHLVSVGWPGSVAPCPWRRDP